MIDTHCHLLPGLDDGPRSLEQAVVLAHLLVEVGTRTVVCTPHFSHRFPTDHERAHVRLRELQVQLARAELPLELRLGAEFGSAAVLDSADAELHARRLGRRHVLVELEPRTPATVVEVVVSRLAEIGLAPIFAHPERCRAVRTQPHVLDWARDRGALVQVVARSLSGPDGDTTEAAWRLLASGRVDVLASDAHRPRHVDRLRHALNRARGRFGDDELRRLIETNPIRILSGGPR